MASHRLLLDDGGHAVVLISCDPQLLTFLNLWGKKWGNKGSFSVEDHTVLELEGASEATSVCFYDVFFLEKDLSDVEFEIGFSCEQSIPLAVSICQFHW
jgi:hypothetical protein